VKDVLVSKNENAVPIYLMQSEDLKDWCADADDSANNWLKTHDFKAKPGESIVVPGPDGRIACVVLGVSAPISLWDVAGLPKSLPEGTYALEVTYAQDQRDACALGWLLGCYAYSKFKGAAEASIKARLVTPDGTDASIVQAFADATALVRDLINAPPNELGPTALSAAAKAVADQFGATFKETVGDDLLTNNYPAIHAVGRAAEDAPRLIEISWGSPDLPTVALVGKGVCFDSGGLDIKSAAGMKLMKKDMGGSAHVLGIAHCVMAMGLKVHLKVLIPAVENAIAGNAMRPGDVVATRAGITVEIGNTDAEGRVILADALTRAGEANPEVVIDCATLTGAARVALGTELPALFCNNDTFADEILVAGQHANDPLWRMPLWPGYRKMIEGKVADITNSPDGGYAGAITAALFLERFAPADAAWAHTDIMAWNISSKPGQPEGGEAMGMRAFVGALATRFGKI